MFYKMISAVAAAAMALGALGAGFASAVSSYDCLTSAPVGNCCDIAANRPNGDPCCYPPQVGDAADVAVDPCCYPTTAGKDGIIVDCSISLASVRGTAFEDKNANGKRDAGEPTMAGAWLKLSGGGSWFVCAYTGADATYGIPVNEVNATYIIFPIAPVGWRTTTPVIKTKTVNTTNGFAFLYNDMGFVRDASVKTVDGCDQYNPSRPVPPGT